MNILNLKVSALRLVSSRYTRCVRIFQATLKGCNLIFAPLPQRFAELWVCSFRDARPDTSPGDEVLDSRKALLVILGLISQFKAVRTFPLSDNPSSDVPAHNCVIGPKWRGCRTKVSWIIFLSVSIEILSINIPSTTCQSRMWS